MGLCVILYGALVITIKIYCAVVLAVLCAAVKIGPLYGKNADWLKCNESEDAGENCAAGSYILPIAPDIITVIATTTTTTTTATTTTTSSILPILIKRHYELTAYVVSYIATTTTTATTATTTASSTIYRY
jgi:hypothetical protein